MWGAIVGGGLGLLKAAKAEKDRKQDVLSRAISARFAPMLGQATPSFSNLPEANPMQDMIDYGLSVAEFSKQFGKKGGESSPSSGEEAKAKAKVASFSAPKKDVIQTQIAPALSMNESKSPSSLADMLGRINQPSMSISNFRGVGASGDY